MTEPVAIDLYSGLGGWAEGFIAEGYRVIGFDIERHDYGTGGYPGELVIRDVRSIHGAELVAEYGIPAVIVGSSPCQEFSYRAMPWKRAKALPPPYLGIELFEAQFRIQREASEAAGRYIPMIVENVRGAQRWVGRARWHFGSYYLWGDVPALMPITIGQPQMKPQDYVRRHGTGSWFAIDMCSARRGIKEPSQINGKKTSRHRELEPKEFRWHKTIMAEGTSKGEKRKLASAMIAKIPFPLAQHIALCFKPAEVSLS